MGFWDGNSGGAPLSGDDLVALVDSLDAGLVGTLVGAGCLVSVGSTKDRGVVMLMVVSEGRKAKGYGRSPEELNDWLAEAVTAATGRDPRQLRLT